MFAQATFCNTLAQIAIRRRDDPGVEDDGLSTTEAAMLLFLQRAQQLRRGGIYSTLVAEL
jgi:hypothetical protein